MLSAGNNSNFEKQKNNRSLEPERKESLDKEPAINNPSSSETETSMTETIEEKDTEE